MNVQYCIFLQYEICLLMDSPRQLYVYIHKRVRNDIDGIKYFVTVFNSIKDVYEVQPLFKSGHKHWVDEWVRRRNGDLYICVPLQLNRFFPITDPQIVFDEEYVKECKYLVLYFGISQHVPYDYYKFVMCFSNGDHQDLEEGVWIDSKNPSDALDKLTSNLSYASDSEESEDKSDQSGDKSNALTNKPQGIYKIAIPIQIGVKVCINSLCPYTKDMDLYC